MHHRHKVQCTGVVRKSPACVQYYGKLKKVMANLHHTTNNVPQAKRSSALQPACWLAWCIGWRSGPLDEQTYRSCAVITHGRLTHIHKHTATITHTHTQMYGRPRGEKRRWSGRGWAAAVGCWRWGSSAYIVNMMKRTDPLHPFLSLSILFLLPTVPHLPKRCSHVEKHWRAPNRSS